MRKLIILATAAGVSASIPIIYQTSPDYFHGLLRSTVEDEEPAQPQLQAKAEPALAGRKVRVAADERGHFQADFKLNGRSVHALIDTGATLVAINRSTAKSIGLSLPQSEFKYEVNTANGTARAATASIADLQIGRIVLHDVQALVLEDAALSNTLIGMSFLKRLSKYAVKDQALILEQ